VLQCVAVCCSVLQCVAVCRSVSQCVAVCCSMLQCVAVCCNALQCVAVCVTPSLATLQVYCIYRLKKSSIHRYLRIANVTIWGLAHTGWEDLRHIPAEGGQTLFVWVSFVGLFCVT